MKHVLHIATLSVIGILGWKVSESMDPTALAMGIGILLGITGTIPGALVVIASNRRSGYQEPKPKQNQLIPHPSLQNWHVLEDDSE